MNAVLAPPIRRTAQRDYLSYSQLALYRQCPLRWWFKYVESLPERFVSSALVFGGAVHRALEFHYRELLCGNPAPDRDLLLAEFWEEWHSPTSTSAARGDQREAAGRGQPRPAAWGHSLAVRDQRDLWISVRRPAISCHRFVAMRIDWLDTPNRCTCGTLDTIREGVAL